MPNQSNQTGNTIWDFLLKIFTDKKVLITTLLVVLITFTILVLTGNLRFNSSNVNIGHAVDKSNKPDTSTLPSSVHNEQHVTNGDAIISGGDVDIRIGDDDSKSQSKTDTSKKKK